jgi:hypothetical protein
MITGGGGGNGGSSGGGSSCGGGSGGGSSCGGGGGGGGGNVKPLVRDVQWWHSGGHTITIEKKKTLSFTSLFLF